MLALGQSLGVAEVHASQDVRSVPGAAPYHGIKSLLV